MHIREVGGKLKLIGEVASFANDLEGTHVVGERSRKQKISDLRTSPGPLWRLHTRFDLFRYRLVAQRKVESMTIGGADPRS